ncbi:MAG: menaquinone biosynthesis protein [Chitinophagaceae bacterium]
MEQKIRVGAVSYLNTKPLLYGVSRNEALMRQIELTEDYPSKVAQQLIDGSIDVGLVPVAIIPKLPQHFIISDYCIGTTGEVASVCLFSDVPLEAITHVLLDYQSRTSVALTKVLLKNYWKISPVLEDTKADFRSRIRDTTAGLVIGDRAFEQRLQSKYVYDLGLAWKAYTGLPFVFAAWIANKPLPPDFVNAFNAANAEGLQSLDKVMTPLTSPYYDLHKYYTENISYHLDEKKRAGLDRFLSEI